jgi:hypothetical protein
MTGDRELTAAEIEVFERDAVLEDPCRISADQYPRLWNMSAAPLYRAVIRAREPVPPEYVTVPLPRVGRSSLELTGVIAQWNMLWEAAQFRRRFFSDEQLPAELREVADRGDVNVVFVPRTATRYHEYAPLFHLLPRSAVERHGLPLLRGGQWPFLAEFGWFDRYIPADFETRLARAWASAVWRHLVPGSPLRAFSGTDPIRLLAHNLDFWLPPVTAVVQEILRDLRSSTTASRRALRGCKMGPCSRVPSWRIPGWARMCGAAKPRPLTSCGGPSMRLTRTASCEGS